VTRIGDDGPIFWSEAAGANVRDVDGNTYVDLTAGFGVAAAGHSHPAVADAVGRQARRLAHAMGDVHPAEAKVELLERLADLAPGDLAVGILSADGSDAVESALKTAVIATGRPGLVAFQGAYHGLGYGALAVTSGPRFREPFRRQLYAGVRFAPFPRADAGSAESETTAALERVRSLIQGARGGPDPVGAVIVEPIQGRAGIVVPPAPFLPGLRALCDDLDVLLIVDEVYTGLGRTGRWFACQHWGVVPDLLVMGKSLAGGLPLSAVLGRPAVMDAWPASRGEAIHTSTFLGNPVTAAAALAHIRAIEEGGLVDRAARLGQRLGSRLESWTRLSPVAGARGLGLMRAVELAGTDAEAMALRVVDGALRHGVILLPEGPALSFTPPLVITDRQLDHALDVVEGLLGTEP
jgi:4-aminobutyrate aminotransferase/(S)-3-amino-2-methylpropionate transaminase